MDRSKNTQKTECNRLHFQIKNLQIESNTMQQKLLGMQRRIQEMESHVGIQNEKWPLFVVNELYMLIVYLSKL